MTLPTTLSGLISVKQFMPATLEMTEVEQQYRNSAISPGTVSFSDLHTGKFSPPYDFKALSLNRIENGTNKSQRDLYMLLAIFKHPNGSVFMAPPVNNQIKNHQNKPALTQTTAHMKKLSCHGSEPSWPEFGFYSKDGQADAKTVFNHQSQNYTQCPVYVYKTSGKFIDCKDISDGKKQALYSSIAHVYRSNHLAARGISIDQYFHKAITYCGVSHEGTEAMWFTERCHEMVAHLMQNSGFDSAPFWDTPKQHDIDKEIGWFIGPGFELNMEPYELNQQALDPFPFVIKEHGNRKILYKYQKSSGLFYSIPEQNWHEEADLFPELSEKLFDYIEDTTEKSPSPPQKKEGCDLFENSELNKYCWQLEHSGKKLLAETMLRISDMPTAVPVYKVGKSQFPEVLRYRRLDWRHIENGIPMERWLPSAIKLLEMPRVMSWLTDPQLSSKVDPAEIVSRLLGYCGGLLTEPKYQDSCAISVLTHFKPRIIARNNPDPQILDRVIKYEITLNVLSKENGLPDNRLRTTLVPHWYYDDHYEMPKIRLIPAFLAGTVIIFPEQQALPYYSVTLTELLPDISKLRLDTFDRKKGAFKIRKANQLLHTVSQGSNGTKTVQLSMGAGEILTLRKEGSTAHYILAPAIDDSGECFFRNQNGDCLTITNKQGAPTVWEEHPPFTIDDMAVIYGPRDTRSRGREEL